MSDHLELHVHTKAGSADSSISADALGQAAADAGTGAVVVAEHFRVWSDWEREAFYARWGVRTYRATEASTDRGHIIVVGAEPGLGMPASGDAVLDLARERGWFTILAHPFRYYFDKIHGSQRPAFPADLTAEELAEFEIFSRVDAIEIENGGCNDRENAMAAAVGELVGKPVTVGSDAHHEHELGVLRLPTPAIPVDEAELVDLLTSLGASARPSERSAQDRWRMAHGDAAGGGGE